ncbi:exocyst complex component EXO70A1-like [Cornus florida]|uniref:exocyst complex component EXO70A1-like n=1 Tax=Cornus florida TaxID=4283 RepID=UPI00289F11CC|nr:exocyst complex component EXO70A1-like [Cornus florida]
MDFFKFFKFRRYKQPQATEALENVVPASESVMDEIQPQTEAPENVVSASESVMDEIQPQTEATTISDDQSKFNSTINIAQLENDFRVILISLTSPTGNNPSKSSTSSYSVTDSGPSYEDYHFVQLNTVKKDDLRSIAQSMKSAGNLEKGVEVYQSVRKTFLDTSLRKLGVKKLSMSDIRSLEWGAFEGTIRQWMQGAKIWVSVLFVSEKRLCKHVFGGLGNGIDGNCFAGTVKDPAFQLFETGKALGICAGDRSRHPEKLFRILDLHEMLAQLWDDLDIIFKSKSLESVGIVAAEMQSQLAKAARETLLQFENDMLHEQSHFQDQRGGIDRVTTYVTKYITQFAYYNEGLTKLIVSKPDYRSNICGDHMTIPEVKLAQLDACTSTPLVVHLIWIIEILQFKLEAKSKCYADASLTQLFMMNNVHYIVAKNQRGPGFGRDGWGGLFEDVDRKCAATNECLYGIDLGEGPLLSER